jgi:hypothetical protein
MAAETVLERIWPDLAVFSNRLNSTLSTAQALLDNK